MADGLDRGVGAELLAQAPDADVDDVRAGVEVVAPDLGEQALAAEHLAGVVDEVVQQPELAVREVGDELADPRLPPREVELEAAGVEQVSSCPAACSRSCARTRASSSSSANGFAT